MSLALGAEDAPGAVQTGELGVLLGANPHHGLQLETRRGNIDA